MSRVIVVKYGARRAVIAAGLRGAPGSGGGSAGVSSFNTRTGAVTLSGADVTTALGYTPANNASLAAVAFSGAYGDLSGTPFIPAAPGDIGAATAAQGALADTAVQPADLTVQLDLKVDKVAGYGLSQENFTAAEKAKLAGLEGSHYRGTYLNLTALQTALPTAEPGDYADVDAGAADPVQRYIWDDNDGEWVAQAGSADPVTAAQVKTLYESNPDTNAYTDSEKSKLAGIAAGATANPDTDSLAESGTPTNRWFTEARVRAALATGLSFADSTVIAATDSFLQIAGKLAARLDLAFDRANHTGSQAISTVTGLDAALDGKEAVLNAGTNITIDRTNPAAPVISASGGGGFTGGTLTSALNEAPAVTIASASTVNIGAAAANTISITGTTTITAFDAIANGAVRLLEFAGALTLTHNGTSLILPTGANIVTAAGDVAEFRSLGSGNWRCIGYLRADGTPLAGGGGGGGLTHFVEAKTTAAPNATVPAVSLAITITETNGDVVLQAKGTGATLAHTPDNATAGGGKRGTRATDWQKLRSNFDQVASGTISVIAGGAYNSATAEGSVVSGGQQNVVTATFATIAGGMGGTVSAPYATISGGNSNTIDSGSDWATIGGGISNRVLGTSQCAIVLGGDGNTASGTHSIVLGGLHATTRGIYGAEARASGRFSSTGDAQRERFIKRRSTTSDTPSTLGTNGAAGGSTNQIILPNNSAFSFKGRVVARENATGDCAAWEFSGLIRRGANAAATALVASVTPTVVAADAGAAAWVVAVTADTTNGGITITVTGEVSHTIRWVADIETVEVAG